MIIIHLVIFLKLFFIGYARGWCEAKTLGDLVGQLQGDPHPPGMAIPVVDFSRERYKIRKVFG